MKVTEHLDRAKNPLFSYEIIPPLRGKSARDILDVVEQVMPYQPPFIDVTSHPAEAYYEELTNGTVRRHVRRKRPGTISICGIIQNRYRIDTVAHLLCRGFHREETEDVIVELNYLGIHNVLAVRGDETNYKKPQEHAQTVNQYAGELVAQLNDLRQGKYLEDLIDSEPIDLCIGVGAYPEKHVESPNSTLDLKYLKQKVDAGADYIVTQMFFDNSDFLRLVEGCRSIGITVPIIPGLKVIKNAKQLTSLPKNFHISLPEALVNELQENPKHGEEIGVRWATQQCRGLLESGVPCVHFYVMNDADLVVEAIQQLGF
jgi:methylenetetrahydrofolate reductase (NADPH)